MTKLRELDAQAHELRNRTKEILEQAGRGPKSKDSDYVFITFVLHHLPHGRCRILVAVIFCATMSATSAVLNALGSTTAIDFYRPLIRPNASDHHYVVAAKYADSGLGFDRHRSRFVCQFGRKSDRSRQHPGVGVLRQHPRAVSGRFLYSSMFVVPAVFLAAVLAQTLVFVLFCYNEYRLSLV